MEIKQKATIKDVAREAGVSTATASIVLNGNENNRITEHTAEKVLKAVERLGYRPNRSAQMLKGKPSCNIGLIFPDISNPFYSEVAKGAIDNASKNGYDTVLFNTDNDLAKEKHAVDSLISLQAGGAIICGVLEQGKKETELLERLTENNIPVVLVDRYGEESKFSYVGIDNFNAGYDMMKVLVEKGHKSIALILQKEIHYILEERLRGCRKAAEDLGIELDDHMMKRIDSKAASATNITGIVDFIETSGCTAVFMIVGDFVAIECLEELGNRGLQVPKDVALVGFDDINLSRAIGLTTVGQPKYEMGWRAFSILKSAILTDDRKVQEDIFDHKILLRKTL